MHFLEQKIRADLSMSVLGLETENLLMSLLVQERNRFSGENKMGGRIKPRQKDSLPVSPTSKAREITLQKKRKERMGCQI
jgi:hypothetical protein